MRTSRLTAIEIQNCELVAFDPSLRRPGIAVFSAGVLTASGALAQDNSDTSPEALGARVTNAARAALEWLTHKARLPRMLVVEWPQIYSAVKSKGDPNDLLAVAGVGAAFATMLSSYVYQSGRGVVLDVRFIQPAQWAGQLPKSELKAEVWNAPRTRRIMSRLQKHEKEVVTMQHDAIDAIGIGLYSLGRMAPTRVFPGATHDPIIPSKAINHV